MSISAKVIADSIANGVRLTTLQLRYPKFIHSELMTHRVFSRNASSSRAIPVDRLIKDVLDDSVYPMHWGRNQPGMQANEEHNELVETYYPSFQSSSREDAWHMARTDAVAMATAFATAGYHKQIVNRLLEPFCHINVVVTSTEWSNFFALRDHPDAQPEMRALAQAMSAAMDASQPDHLLRGQWHTPYFNDHIDSTNESLAIKCSIARCARVSYLTQEGKKPDIGEDLKLCDRLLSSVPLHASPAEHQATPDRLYAGGEFGPRWQSPHLHGNLRGWVQYRKTLKGECQ